MQKCDKCKHSDICKWCESMKQQQNAVDKIVEENCCVWSPITIKVECSKFEEKLTDNFWYYR